MKLGRRAVAWRERGDAAAHRELASALPDQPETSLRRQEVLAPMSGRIVERKVELGAIVGRDNLETELFVIADLDRVWVEVAVSPEDAPLVRNGPYRCCPVSARANR